MTEDDFVKSLPQYSLAPISNEDVFAFAPQKVEAERWFVDLCLNRELLAVVYSFVAWYVAWGVIVLSTDAQWIHSGYYLFLIILWTFIYRYSLRSFVTANAKELTEKELIETPQHPNTKLVDNTFATRVEQYIALEQPWLNSSLTLQELADSLDTNRTYLSEYFNKTLGTTFYDYLNDFRIKQARELLLSNPNDKLLKIGELSGFNSLSTFRRAFEKQTGMTPVQYRRQNIS